MMKKLVMLLTVLAAFVVIGCGSDNKPTSAPTQSPQAAPAVQKQEPKQENQQTSKPKRKKVTFDEFKKENGPGTGLPQFKY